LEKSLTLALEKSHLKSFSDFGKKNLYVKADPSQQLCSGVGMAGLGLFPHKSALALAPRGLLQSAYDFLCLIYTKGPEHRERVQGSFNPRSKQATRKKRFWAPQRGFGDAILYTKT
jgi:hypothetical protein